MGRRQRAEAESRQQGPMELKILLERTARARLVYAIGIERMGPMTKRGGSCTGDEMSFGATKRAGVE